MLPIRKPDKRFLAGVLKGLLDGRYSREEVMTWQRAVVESFGDSGLSVPDGYWYFESLSVLTVPISLGDDEPFFIRGADIDEYHLDLLGVDAAQTYRDVLRLRSHQIDHDAVRWPLVMFEHDDSTHLNRLGLTPVRGIFDVHLDLVEHVHLRFNGDLYLIVRQYDDQAHQVMVLGTNRDDARLRELLSILEMV